MTNERTRLLADRRVWLLADRKSLRRLLADIPAEDVLDRSGLESRLKQIEHELSQLEGVKE